MFLIPGDHRQATAPGDGRDQRIIVGRQCVPAFSREPAPFRRRRLVKNKNRLPIILQNEIVSPFQLRPNLRLGFEFDAPAYFRQRERGNSNLPARLREPILDRVARTKIIADGVRVREVFQNRPGGTFF